jgi:hypothetical protein
VLFCCVVVEINTPIFFDQNEIKAFLCCIQAKYNLLSCVQKIFFILSQSTKIKCDHVYWITFIVKLTLLHLTTISDFVLFNEWHYVSSIHFVKDESQYPQSDNDCWMWVLDSPMPYLYKQKSKSELQITMECNFVILREENDLWWLEEGIHLPEHH